MKEAIKKVMENGLFEDKLVYDLSAKKMLKLKECDSYEVTVYSDSSVEITATNPIKGIPSTNARQLIGVYKGSAHDLIFGTPFIEYITDATCSDGKEQHNGVPVDCLNSQQYGITCKDCSLYNDAEWHLKQISNPEISRDIDKLKEYVRGLV